MSDQRPNPDELLRGVQRLEKSEGRLRIFFGMSPGVGKTYAMLKAAHARKDAGDCVLVGIVETHGRSETEALLAGLEVVSRQKFSYRGTEFSDLSLDEILRARPALVLVDELAHSNPPGARHAKRYQDIDELLRAGIDVYTTLNVQHVESRADLVYQITGVPVRETVPDSFLTRASQIELIDLSPPELLKRLKEGKVYLGDRAERAAANFFKEEHITALRELALRLTAEKVDNELRDQRAVKGIRGTWNTNERLLVAVSHSPYSARLVRATRRMAFNLEAPWIALYVDNGEPLNEEDRATLEKNLALAKELGAEVVLTKETGISAALKRVAEERNVTQLVMGRPDRRFIRDLFSRGTILERLVGETSDIDVHVMRQERKPRYRGFRPQLPELRTGFIPYWNTFWFLSVFTAFAYGIAEALGYQAVGFLFLIAVLGLSLIASRGPVLFAAVFSALAWNFFFIPPAFTFRIVSFSDIMMCLTYFAVASVSGMFTSRIRRQDQELRQREHRAGVLYELTKDLAEAKEREAICLVGQESLRHLFKAKALFLLAEDHEELKPAARPGNETLGERDLAVAQWVFLNGKPAGWSTETLSSAGCLCLPLSGRERRLGVLVLSHGRRPRLTLEQKNLLENVCQNLGLALERDQLARAAKATKLLEESERLHQTLLNSVSHELRTPLTTLVGAASALRDPRALQDPVAVKVLSEELIASAERLNRVVENLLDMSRLESGALRAKEELLDVSDLLSSVITRYERLLGKVLLVTPAEPIWVKGDESLLEHAVLNLFLNAAKYGGGEISAETRIRGGAAELLVRDQGNGISSEALPRLFDKFYRAPGAAPGGTGLGLSIVKSITELHGGEARAANGDPRGAIFTISLPRATLPIGGE
jgi:two-component system sensor histidine kinase KdpD